MGAMPPWNLILSMGSPHGPHASYATDIYNYNYNQLFLMQYVQFPVVDFSVRPLWLSALRIFIELYFFFTYL